MDITLEDVESAILVLREFVKRQREAQRVLRQVGVREGRGYGMPFSMEDVMRLAMEKAKEKHGLVEEVEPEVSEDDLARMRAITKKRKEESEKSPTSR